LNIPRWTSIYTGSTAFSIATLDSVPSLIIWICFPIPVQGRHIYKQT